jgi:2-oxoglutarate ferredoxin oxidoreductase subunit gamma
MHEQIICAGFGGQGIMLMGKLLAEAGMREGYNVTWLPSYGAEVASPTISAPTTCVIMNKPSLAKFMGKMKKGGLLIVNTSMVDKILETKSVKIAGIPLTALAAELGNIKVANMIAVGAFLKLKKILSVKTVLEELERALAAKKDIISVNKKAIKLGYDSVG